MNTNIIGNLTTIGKILITTIAPAIAVYLGTDEQTTITLLTAIAGLAYGIIDTKYKSTYFNKTPETPTEEVIITDIDPAGDYE